MSEEDGEGEGGENERKVIVEHRFKHVGSDGSTVDFEPPTNEDGEELTTEEKLAEREAQLALLAEKAFEDDKQKVLEAVPASQRAQVEAFIGSDPTKLEMAKLKFNVLGDEGDGTEPVPPKGKVRSPIRKPQSGKNENAVEELYKIRMKKAVTPDEVMEQQVADGKIDELFEQLEDGLRDRQGSPYKFTVTACSKCGSVIQGKLASDWASGKAACPVCGYKAGPKGGQ